MNPTVALLIYSVGIGGLFYLDRDKSARTSIALWLPVIWIWISGSRPLSVWFNLGAPTSDAAMQAIQLDGSQPDRIFFQVLVVLGAAVIIRRAMRTQTFLAANWPILVFFFYCLVSVLWSDFPDVSAKRWIKAIGDLLMVLIVVTDAEPIAALKRFFSRTGFILLPASILLIKYYGDLGRSYDPWFGTTYFTGVTTNKNALGVITFTLSLAAVWRILLLLRSPELPNRRRHLLAQAVLLGFGIWILSLANSATSLACFIVGAALMLVTGLPVFRRRPEAVHALVLALLVTAGAALLFGGEGEVLQALGRNSTLTGRTQIWGLVIPMAPNAFVGAGFESFWLGARLEKLWRALPVLHLNEAHDGYIEVYLNLGWVGLCLLATVLINGYRRSVATFRHDPGLGSLLLAYILTAALYSVTEAGFRMMNPMWVIFLLAVAASGGVASGALAQTSQPHVAPVGEVSRLPAKGRVAARAFARNI
ncbi:MAG: O-antigen ligase family protein [Candidatus Acidiferrales bacterium]